jgi:hypothetical protein
LDTNSTTLADEDKRCEKIENNIYKMKDRVTRIFIGYCSHKIDYKFHIMLEFEGKKNLMKVLVEKMFQIVLNNFIMVYDFVCQASVYVLKRELKIFRRTKFVID